MRRGLPVSVRVPCRNCLWCEHPGWLIPRRAGAVEHALDIEGRSVSVRVVTRKTAMSTGSICIFRVGVST